MASSIKANADGTTSVLNGSGQEVLKIPSTAGANVNVATLGDTLGVGQTWQDVTASRGLGTTYTNSTGKPIMVTFESVYSSGQSVAPVATIGGYSFNLSVVVTSSTSQSFVGAFMVPVGATYSITSQKAISKWSELR